MKKSLFFIFLLAVSSVLQAADYTAGKHYKPVTPQATSSGDKVEVLEFFWYGCPHCYNFEPYLKAWKKNKPENVAFVRVPATFRPEWEVQARAYYALESMGDIEKVHEKIFAAIHKDKQRMNDIDTIADFVEKHGVDRKEFLVQANSFSVDGKVRKAKKLQKAYRIQGVPSIIVNGKYLTSGSMSGSYDALIKIMNYLIEKESANK